MLSERKPIFRFGFMVMALMMVLTLGMSRLAGAQGDQPPGSQSDTTATGPNLLAHPNFDDSGFYFRYPNSLVADGWFRWWVYENHDIPEFIDGGTVYHNICYPPPTPGGLCVDTHNKSQGYIRMGTTWIAGIWQPVQVMPCLDYQFEGHVRNDATKYHPKVGINPLGWKPPERPGDFGCSTKGHTQCYKEGLSKWSDMSIATIWSGDIDPPAYEWTVEPVSVVAEALSTTITVWTYTAPERGGSMSTYWDDMSLVQVQPSSGVLMTGTLPAADGSILNVTASTTALRANLSWQTSQPALTQVLYHYVGDATLSLPPDPVTDISDFELHTSVNTTLATAHSARLVNLRPQSLYDYAILSRQLVEGACQRSAYIGRFSTTDKLLPAGSLPAPGSDIIGPYILSGPNSSAYVVWQSAKPSYSQVLYHYFPPPAIYPTMTNRVYLPLIAMTQIGYGSTYDYELRTPPDLTFATLHVITLTNLLPDSLYEARAVSAWSEGDLDKVAVSVRAQFRTAPAGTVVIPPEQFIEQLQACLADRQKLDVCVDQAVR